ncbi:glycosyltransferase family 4 protein [Halovibrio salipaludis]|nr:glycosyltransferase family 4 protein [Halovibrio salipaludis]
MQILMTALQPGGGIRTFFRYIYGQPCFSDCTFTLIAPDQGLSAYLSEFLPEGRIKVVEAESSNLAFVRQVRRAHQTGNYDLIHSHGFSAGLLTEISLGLGGRTPHLMTAHDVFLHAQFQGASNRIRHWVMARLFARMTGIHAVTEDAAENFRTFFPKVSPSRIHGILHGVDAEYFRDGTPRNLREEFGIAPDTPIIGFFGRFMNQKGFRLLVDAMADIREQNLLEPLPHVITFGWGAFIREDYDYLREKGLGDLFHQAEQTNDMAAALKGVDVVAMPSRWEACGLLAMEAMAAGVPIVGSDCVGLREILAGSPAQTIHTGDSRSLRDALIRELEDLPSRTTAFEAYQSKAVERFAIDRPAKAIRSLYQDLERVKP